MTEAPTPPPGQGKSGNFWSRRSKLGKGLLIGLAVIIAISVIGALIPSNNDDEAASTTKATVTETEPAETQEPASVVTGKVTGVFNRDCFLCDERLVTFIKTSNAWCGWQDGKVIVHVRMQNRSVEHITVNWHPSYTLVGGGEHGAGLTSAQSDGFDSGEIRDLFAEQDPEGVQANATIETCKPSFSVIESG